MKRLLATGLIASLALLTGCGDTQTVNTPASAPAWSLGSYTPAQLAAAKVKLAANPCTEDARWKCGIVLADGGGDYKNGYGWVAVIVRPGGQVELVTNAWSLDTKVAELTYPPGVTVRWDDHDHDDTVGSAEIQVIS